MKRYINILDVGPPNANHTKTNVIVPRSFSDTNVDGINWRIIKGNHDNMKHIRTKNDKIKL